MWPLTFKTAEENDFVSELATDEKGNRSNFWTGAYREPGGSYPWEWKGRRQILYTNVLSKLYLEK